jgi:hypothetical protein
MMPIPTRNPLHLPSLADNITDTLQMLNKLLKKQRLARNALPKQQVPPPAAVMDVQAEYPILVGDVDMRPEGTCALQ